MKAIIAVLSAFILCVGCYPSGSAIYDNWAVERAENRILRIADRYDLTLIENHTDTFLIPKIKVDTIFAASDTFELVTDSVIIRYVLKRDTVHLNVECLPDTIVRTRPVERIKITDKPQNTILPRIGLVGWMAILLILLTIFYRRR